MLNRVKIGLSLAAGLLSANAAFADHIQCDQKQTYCIVEAKRIIVGDSVGIFNDDNELVATGEVSRMKEAKRRVEITKRLGTIYNGYDVRRLEDGEQSDLPTHFSLYKSPSKISGGAGMGLTKINLAEETSAYTAQGFGQYRWKKDILLVGRGHFFTASGVAVNTEDDDQLEDFSVQGFSLIPAVAYELLRKEKFSFRGETGLGLAYVSTSSSGAQAAKSLDKVSPGAGVAMRGAVSMLYNRMGEWHPEVMAEFMKIQNSQAMSLNFGIVKELK